ncbi:MAG: transcriptional regulator, partial [Anaerolineae bacterium]
LEGLFDVLAHEVLEQQPEDVRRFLVQTAALQDLTPGACNAVRAASDSAAMLAYLRRQELFIFEQGDGSLRYHPIFHRFLRQQASALEKQEAHRRAAAFFRREEQPARAVYHLLKARDFHAAGEVLETYGAALLSQGRLDTLAAYLDALPPEIFHAHPVLLCYLGDLARLHSRFQEALNWYQQAEAVWRARSHTEGVSRALRGQARVYLDTVNPSAAESLLEEALRLSDGIPDREARARLYELLAENKLNAGKIAEAEALRQQAALHREGPSDAQLLFRVLLRTGRLDEARRQLEAREASERTRPVHTPRAHRETPLLLSLIYAFQGEPALALEKALAGRERGVALESPFVTAVGHMRAGHARAMMGEYPQARRDFEAAIEISRTLSVPRLQVEAHWGLCRVYGYQGDLTEARRHAEEGIRIAAQAGDEWIASLIRLTMGAALTLAQHAEEARTWLQQAAQGFHACSDPFGADAARLWLALNWFAEGHTALLETRFPALLEDVRRNGYDFLFTRSTLLGLPDERRVVPLLLWARARTIEPHFIAQLLQQMGLAGIQFHPGYRLRVRTLGGFQVWRGAQPIRPEEWQRASARSLFQVLLTFRHQPLERDQICEYLWPGAEPRKASSNFKVALNALYKVLEPHRKPGQESSFVLREGSVYALRPGADLWLDAQAFLDAAQRGAQGDEAALEESVRLYQGEYLPEARYEPWAEAERKFLTAHFLRAADRLCAIYLERGQAGECLTLAQRILAQDNCWERAYRHLMRAHALLGDRGQVARIYRRCVETLRAELDVSPAAETEALYRHLMEG